MQICYTFHTDAGHGWLAVKYKELVRLNILDKISGCSYQSKTGQTVYLEEDCDATLFIITKKAAGEIINFKESYKENSPIRNFRMFNG